MALKLPDSAVPMGDFPVAKAVDIDFNDGENLQEKLDNGKLGGGGSSPEKQYYQLSQLGITTPCTIKDIWDKMPSGSITIIDADSSIVTDLDVIRIALGISDGDEVYGILTVVKLTQRTTLEFRRARANSVMIPDTFIGYCYGRDGTSIQWKRMVITSVTTNLDDLFQSVSSGKTLVANAITDKGVSTATDATFATMASNISKITNYTKSEKEGLATAITNKGVSTSSTDSFSTMATNISKINGYKEETVSYDNTSTGATRLVFTFSADVSGVKQIKPPSNNISSHIVPETETSMFTINGKKLTLYVNGVGRWKVTAMVNNA